MRCPYCAEDIHDQSVKCPFCQRLLVERPGWRRSREEQAAATATRTEAQPRAAVTDRPRIAVSRVAGPPRPRSATVGLVLLFAAAGLAGYIVGRMTMDVPPAPVAPTVIEQEDAGLREVAEQRLAEIQRLREDLREAEQAPTNQELETAIVACEQALTLVIQREGSLFATDAGRAELVRLANRCLAPLGKEVELV